MIIALKTRILVTEIAICEARAGEGGGEGWGWEASCVACNFFWFYLHVFFFFLGFSPGFHPTASSRSTQVFLRGIYMDRLFFSHSPFYVNQHPFWCIVQSAMLAFVAKYIMCS